MNQIEDLIEYLCQPCFDSKTGETVIAQKLSLEETECINKKFEQKKALMAGVR